jgi:hypothetical protein
VVCLCNMPGHDLLDLHLWPLSRLHRLLRLLRLLCTFTLLTVAILGFTSGLRQGCKCFRGMLELSSQSWTGLHQSRLECRIIEALKSFVLWFTSEDIVVSFLCRYARCARRICVLRLCVVVSLPLLTLKTRKKVASSTNIITDNLVYKKHMDDSRHLLNTLSTSDNLHPQPWHPACRPWAAPSPSSPHPLRCYPYATSS